MRFLCMFLAKILTGEWNLQRTALVLSMSEHNLQSAYISWFRSLLGRIQHIFTKCITNQILDFDERTLHK